MDDGYTAEGSPPWAHLMAAPLSQGPKHRQFFLKGGPTATTHSEASCLLPPEHPCGPSFPQGTPPARPLALGEEGLSLTHPVLHEGSVAVRFPGPKGIPRKGNTGLPPSPGFLDDSDQSRRMLVWFPEMTPSWGGEDPQEAGGGGQRASVASGSKSSNSFYLVRCHQTLGTLCTYVSINE